MGKGRENGNGEMKRRRRRVRMRERRGERREVEWESTHWWRQVYCDSRRQTWRIWVVKRFKGVRKRRVFLVFKESLTLFAQILFFSICLYFLWIRSTQPTTLQTVCYKHISYKQILIKMILIQPYCWLDHWKPTSPGNWLDHHSFYCDYFRMLNQSISDKSTYEFEKSWIRPVPVFALWLMWKLHTAVQAAHCVAITYMGLQWHRVASFWNSSQERMQRMLSTSDFLLCSLHP